MKKTTKLDIDGIFLLNKSYGMSSNHALQKVKRLFNAKKAGHTGSLDPLATGVLPICLGEATKFSGYLLDADKAYRVVARLGSATSTLDAEGAVTQTSAAAIPDDWEPLLQQFRGPIEQIPPMYSALKHNGKKLYELAREGIEIKRKSRAVTIYQCVLCNTTADTIELDVVCSKGTYIRTLVDDLGRLAGCLAHVIKLERYKVADFLLENSMSIAELEKYIASEQNPSSLLLAMDAAVTQYPCISLDAKQVVDLFHGKKINLQHPDASLLRAYDEENNFLGLVTINNGILAAKRLRKQ